MSDLEIEKAAMGPRRWIELCGAYDLNDPNSDAIRYPRSIRIINEFPTESSSLLFLVPGGRYLVSYSFGDISVWDLGYTSSADCTLIASVGVDRTQQPVAYDRYDHFEVQATPDGMGLTIYTNNE